MDKGNRFYFLITDTTKWLLLELTDQAVDFFFFSTQIFQIESLYLHGIF